MDYRYLGRSGFRVPALSLGTATFGGKGSFFVSAEKRDRFDECLAIVERLLSGERVTCHAKFSRLDAVKLNVEPIRRLRRRQPSSMLGRHCP
jgi:alkanesulfonate monooxygenase SsuD/methylene tetrahydromethanopterin reductase-like flavin-dependent oxidoreductase (luciferase family)